MKLGINVLGTKGDLCMYKNFCISLPFQNGGHVLGVFCINGQTAGFIFMKFGINAIGTKAERFNFRDFKISLPFQNGGRV
jgi:hypothetical protein